MNRVKYIFAIIAAVLLAACRKEVNSGLNGNATLSVCIRVPAIGASVKSVSGNPSDPQTWTQWERAVDGRYLYRVTAFLLQGDRMVASKDLVLDGEDEQAEASLSFDGNFVHGTYKLMVAANYSAHTANDGDNGNRNYSGITEFTNTVDEILGTRGVLENFTGTYSDSFVKFMIASQEGICPKVPQPLSLVKEIELHPGSNLVEGELLRTYSRIRIAIENHSDEQLSISSLEFSNLFTQTRAYIFPDRGFYNERSTINTSGTNAITPFTATNGTPLLIPGKSATTIFDAYILESSKNSSEENYTYSIGLGYGGSEKYIVKSTTAINDPANISKGYYVIYNARRGRRLKSGSDKVEGIQTGVLEQGAEIAKEHVWALDNTGLSGNNYYIGTPEILQEGDQTAYYMAQTSSNGVLLNSLFNSDYSFSFSTYTSNNSNYLTIRSSERNNNLYLDMDKNGNVTGAGTQSNSTRFYLYPVERSGATVYKITLETINKQDGQAYAAEEIKRNDFVNVVVSVSYNKNTGHFTFEVKDWNTAGGDINFN